MIKKTLFTMIIMAAFISGPAVFGQEMKAKKTADVAKVEINNFATAAEKLVGKEVQVEGMVTHVCKHGGKKMFLMSDNADVQVKITTGEDMAAFPVELEGSTVWVKGIVEAMDVEVEEEAEEEGHEEDEAHKNIYHKKQYSVSALKYKVKE
jgi:RecJ-like exonuclease